MPAHENPDDAAQAVLLVLYEQLVRDAERVVVRWEKGDLAAAVRMLDGTAKAIRALEESME